MTPPLTPHEKTSKYFYRAKAMSVLKSLTAKFCLIASEQQKLMFLIWKGKQKNKMFTSTCWSVPSDLPLRNVDPWLQVVILAFNGNSKKL